jgi:ribonuclease HI
MTSAYYILNTDGGMDSTGRRSEDDPPGEAAVAVLLSKTKKGRKTEIPVESFARRIGPRMNDEAEYEALLEGLRTAIRHGATHVRAFMDSEFVVEQINNGVVPNEDDLIPLFNEAEELIERFAPKVGFRLSWIPRQRNAERTSWCERHSAIPPRRSPSRTSPPPRSGQRSPSPRGQSRRTRETGAGSWRARHSHLGRPPNGSGGPSVSS